MKSNAMTVAAARGFEGTIQGATLHDLIQMECLTMSTRAVRVTRGGRTGRIFFTGGQIVHAETGELVGERALFELMSWAGGHFGFEDGVRPMEDTIDRDWHGLLLESAHRIDENANANVPTMTAIPMPTISADEVFKDPEILQAVQFTEDGTLVTSRAEDPETMQASFAYIEQLTRLVGGALGLEGLQEIHVASGDKKALAVINESQTTVVITTPKANHTLLAKQLS
jgi:hypothetical protein